jgi:hypothetical protein
MTKKQDVGEKSYEEFVKEQPLLEKVVTKTSWDYLDGSNKGTVNLFIDGWSANIRKNKKYFRRHGSIAKDLIGIGKNRAVIAVGAGASFNKNAEFLRRTIELDTTRRWEDRHYVVVACNHQFKPLLELGIIPDFVMSVDYSDVIYDQLNTDIPEHGQHTILLTGPHTSPKVIKEWDRQGRDIRFYLSSSDGIKEAFEESMGRSAEPHMFHTGGNVLNSIWALALKFFGSSVYMCVGNDLSYELNENPDVQRSKYYADGDYSTNAEVTGTGRDEAKGHKMWMGFQYTKSPVLDANGNPQYTVEIEPVGTSKTLWVYKTWIEGQVALNQYVRPFHYYNCSEGGILGVMSKSEIPEVRGDADNWFLLDDICKRYHTKRLEDAVEEFSSAKEAMNGC